MNMFSCNDGWTPISLNVVFYHNIIVLESLAWFPDTPQYNRECLYTLRVTVFLCITTQYTDLEPPIHITLNNRQEHYTVTHASTFKPERGKFCVLCAFNSVLYILARMSGSISRQSGRRFIGEFISITGSEVHVFAAEGVLAVSLLRQMQKSVLTTDKKSYQRTMVSSQEEIDIP